MRSFKQWIKANAGWLVYKRQLSGKSARLLNEHRAAWQQRVASPLHQAGMDLFTYHGEDGILNYLVGKCGDIPKKFADIGSGDCIKSNCAALAVHGKWEGLFIDQDRSQLETGRRFYRSMLRRGASLRFSCASVSPGAINELLQENGMNGAIGLLSIDIDGNDYWIWKAISVIQPVIVVIEAKVEFGTGNYVVPYGPANHHAADKAYNGASVKALCLLAKQKGYKLAGANKQGYNLFFVKNEVRVPEQPPESVLEDPDTIRSFYPEDFFSTHHFEQH